MRARFLVGVGNAAIATVAVMLAACGASAEEEMTQSTSDGSRRSRVSIVFAGPVDLRRAYEGDMEAVESAIHAVAWGGR